MIGKHETLVDDLVRQLKLSGETFDEEKLRAVKSQNVGCNKTGVTFPGYSYALARDVFQHDNAYSKDMDIYSKYSVIVSLKIESSLD